MTPEKEKTHYQTIIQNQSLTPIQRLILIYLNTLEADFIEGRLTDISELLGIGRTTTAQETIKLHAMGYLQRENMGRPGDRYGIRLSDFRP